MGAQRRRKMKMACTAVAFALVVLTLAEVTEAKQNTIVEMRRLRTHVGGKLANRRTTSSYSSGSGQTPTTASTPAPTGAPTSGTGGGTAGPAVKPVVTITQTLTISSAKVTLASYSGNQKLVFEGAYAVGCGIATVTGGAVKYSAGCSCTSSAVAARRAGVKITFVVKVSEAKQTQATKDSKALTKDLFITHLSTVKSGVTAFTSVDVPTVAQIVLVGTPTVEIVVSGASSLTVSLFAIIALSFGVVLR